MRIVIIGLAMAAASPIMAEPAPAPSARLATLEAQLAAALIAVHVAAAPVGAATKESPGIAALRTALEVAIARRQEMDMERAAKAYADACIAHWGEASIANAECQLVIAEKLGTRQAAAPYTARALKLLSAAGPEAADLLARARSFEGDILMTRGTRKDAVKALTLALDQQSRSLGDTNYQTLLTIARLATVAQSDERLADAQMFLDRANVGLLARSRLNMPGEPRLIELRVGLAANQASIYLIGNALEKAEAAMRSIESEMAPILSADDYRWSRIYERLTLILRYRGDFVQSEIYARKSIELVEQLYGKDHPTVAAALNNLAMAMPLSRAAEQEELMRRAVAIMALNAATETTGASQMTGNLGLTLIRQQQFAAAIPYLEQAAAIQRRQLAPDHLTLLGTLNLLAKAQTEIGQPKPAEALALQTLKIATDKYGEGHRVAIEARLLAGEARIADHRYAEALDMLGHGVEIYDRGLGAPNYSDAAFLGNMTGVYLQMGNQTAAWAAVQKAMIGYRSQGAARFTSDRQLRGLATMLDAAYRVQGNQSGATDVAFAIMQAMTNSDTAAASVEAAARQVAGSDELRAIARQRDGLQGRINDLDKARLAAHKAGNQADIDRVSAETFTTRAELAKADALVDEKFPRYKELAAQQTVTFQQLNRGGGVLGHDEAILHLLQADDALYAMLISSRGEQIIRAPLTRAQVGALVSSVRASVDLTRAATVTELPDFDLAAAHALYLAIFPSFKAALRPIKTLFVVADGPLAALPFALLVEQVAKPGGSRFDQVRRSRFLAERYVLANLPSAATLVASRRFAPAPTPLKQALAMADPAFNGSSPVRSLSDFASLRGGLGVQFTAAAVCKLQRLPDTRREATALANRFGAENTTVKLGSEASEATLGQLQSSEKLAAFDVLLFATHGLVSGTLNGIDEPALALSPRPDCRAASPAEDGLLTASEISDLKLNAQWVILTGCNTAAAGGKYSPAPLSGLARAFLFSGARRLLVSNWNIDSRSAADLVTDLLSARNAGRDPGSALMHAMQSLRSSKGDLAYRSHPAFWAPFVLVGDSR